MLDDEKVVVFPCGGVYNNHQYAPVVTFQCFLFLEFTSWFLGEGRAVEQERCPQHSPCSCTAYRNTSAALQLFLKHFAERYSNQDGHIALELCTKGVGIRHGTSIIIRKLKNTETITRSSCKTEEMPIAMLTLVSTM